MDSVLMKLTGLTSDEIMDLVDLVVCLPLVLLMNFSLFQYLLTTFYRRRREPLVSLLLSIAFHSFFSLIPFGFSDEELVRDLNDISEVCLVLTFLIQISVLTRDINKKMKLRFIRYMMYIGECLVVLGLVVILSNVIDLLRQSSYDLRRDLEATRSFVDLWDATNRVVKMTGIL